MHIVGAWRGRMVLFFVSALLVGLWMVLPLPAALSFATGRHTRALVVVGGAMLVALVSREPALVQFALLVALGLPLGFGLSRGWTYGRVVALVAVLAFAAMAVPALIAWDTWIAEAGQFHRHLVDLIESAGEQGVDDASERVIALSLWLFVDHWAYVGFGVLFGPVLMVVCGTVSLAAAALRLTRASAAPKGSFREMRTPEWAVWLGILLAVLWFVDQRWPVSGLRAFVWNAALILAAVYWMNGISVVAFGLGLWRLHPAVHAAAVIALVVTCGALMPCAVGLFDTWADFRGRLKAWDDARRSSSGTGRGDEP